MATACTIAVLAARAHADQVADFLQRHQLRGLLVAHYESQLEQVKPEERSEILLQLASLYAEILDTTDDAARRSDYEARSRRLLEQTPPDAADELRLALMRIAFRSAEKIAENHRLRLASDAEVESARKTLSEIIPELKTLSARFKQKVDVHNRRSSEQATTPRAMESADRTARMYAQSMFLCAWALYYDAWLNQRPDSAREAEPLFAVLLETENTHPNPSDVAIDNRSEESVARSILGMALCKSLTGSSATALDWIAMLQHEATFEPLRMQATAWRIAIHLEHAEYEPVKDMLQQAALEKRPWPMTWLRLAAGYALSKGRDSVAAEELARQIVLEIAARGELDQIIDLANRFGADSLGTSGFALQYVHGVIKYQHARTVHGSESPTTEAHIVQLYQEAATHFRAALSSPPSEADGAVFSGQSSFTSSCRKLLAWSLYFQSRLWDAHEEFLKLAEALVGNEAADAMWMAIISLDQLAEQGDEQAKSALRELADRFLAEFPSNEHAPTLRLRGALAKTEASERTVEDLLAIPPNAPAHHAAQRRAADLLYQLFRKASGEEKYHFANRFLSLAVGLISDESRRIDMAQEGGAQNYLVRCRQVLEVALAEGIGRAAAAQAAFTGIEQLAQEAEVDIAEIESELQCRRAQLLLLQDDLAGAAKIADQLWSSQQNSVWSRLISRAVFKHAHDRWKSIADAQQQQDWLDHVVRYGGRVLYEFKDGDESLAHAAIGYQTAVAEASMAQWQRSQDAEKAKAALFLFEKLLAARPLHAPYLRATAILSEALTKPQQALDCWRRLASGSDPTTEGWFEAKYHLIKLLLKTDPQRARDVMDQHKALNPNYGMPPWGDQLRALDAQIAAAMKKGEAE